MKDRHVGVLMGGNSPERDVSLRSGEAVAAALERRGWYVTRVYVDGDVDRVLREAEIDVAFLALHGTMGEDGCIQGLLEVLGIPYTGSGVLASALAMDKLKAKELFRLHNVPTPPYYVVDADRLDELESVHGWFGFPVFVKPRRSGSSVGAGIAHDLEQLRARCEHAARFDRCVLVERFVRGAEVAVGILDGRALGTVEIVPRGDFYDYRSKYQPGQSDYYCPARLTPTRRRCVETLAERAHAALGCRGATRVDVLVTEGDNEYVLEVNTLPGMTPTSLLPRIAASAGMSFEDLCEAILERALLDRAASTSAGPEARPVTPHDALAAVAR
ncbi:MAG: D-alanine--D-alanine ligase [Myxococcota bacterium]|nr:D-alanine--D-alanine ligase [Myxococcota bacterium]MDW8361347.1 D-alanine--D-alanine ligase [Myxococcales bacterium]